MKYLLILNIFLAGVCYSQHAIFPLQVGTRWHYQNYFASQPDSGGYEIRVIGDTTFSNGKSYAIRNWYYPDSGYKEYLRQANDTVYAYRPSDTSECILYRFNLNRRDSTCESEFWGSYMDTIFGKPLKVYRFNDFVPGFGADVADSIGVFNYYADLGWSDHLIGALIHDIAYGTIDNVKDNVSDQKHVFHLLQNYPNPFNPSTTIWFSLTRAAWVNLTVFDLLGQQIAVLVNESRTSGDHAITWKPETIPSGVYLYQLRVGDETSTRLMLYIK